MKNCFQCQIAFNVKFLMKFYCLTECVVWRISERAVRMHNWTGFNLVFWLKPSSPSNLNPKILYIGQPRIRATVVFDFWAKIPASQTAFSCMSNSLSEGAFGFLYEINWCILKINIWLSVLRHWLKIVFIRCAVRTPKEYTLMALGNKIKMGL